MKNKKGFTLIELLAVIIILGVLMIIAIPSVTEYIQTARKKAYVSILD
ncbi:MAG: prepilin-type N-terminal cleavage/methylation domain-containing protein, partial [Bacilli bacterium]|nr:prepilin-type N-terminal cleavage/methylation domain-containing protein [Bacilli bacterium]